VLAVRHLPDLLRVAGGCVEQAIRPLLGTSLAVLAVDEEYGSGRDPCDRDAVRSAQTSTNFSTKFRASLDSAEFTFDSNVPGNGGCRSC
jgi:hypothetical protein